MKFFRDTRNGLLKCFNDDKTKMYALAGPVKLLLELGLVSSVQDADRIADKWLVVENNDVVGERESEVFPDKAAAKADMAARYKDAE